MTDVDELFRQVSVTVWWPLRTTVRSITLTTLVRRQELMGRDRPRRAERGYTLVEVAVAAVPMAVIALSLFAAFGFTVTFARRAETQVEELQRAAVGLSFLARELSEASAALGRRGALVSTRRRGSRCTGLSHRPARGSGPALRHRARGNA